VTKAIITPQPEFPSPLSNSPDIASNEARLLYLDALRGLIMILMALDHASLFIAHKHSAEFWGQPLPNYAGALPFLTRFVTHFCAPGFFFLMGIGMMLFAASRRQLGWTDSAIRKHFLTRGALLIVLQLFIENPAWVMGPAAELGSQPPGGGSSVMLHFGVLYGLGASMIVCAFLLRLNAIVLACISLLAVLLTQALIPGPDKVAELYSPLARLLLIPGHTNIVQVFYPLLPWLGLAVFGLIFARWILDNPAAVPRKAALIGAGFLLLFLLVRLTAGFGNIHPVNNSTWITFLNVTKYPPSLAYILLTLGVDLLLLALFAGIVTTLRRWAKPLFVFGQTALFFYLAHLYLYAVMGLTITPAGGTSLGWMYAYWAGGLVLLCLLCIRYRKFKHATAPNSVWRFF
jgi:uncharacterized membrane protein